MEPSIFSWSVVRKLLASKLPTKGKIIPGRRKVPGVTEKIVDVGVGRREDDKTKQLLKPACIL